MTLGNTPKIISPCALCVSGGRTLQATLFSTIEGMSKELRAHTFSSLTNFAVSHGCSQAEAQLVDSRALKKDRKVTFIDRIIGSDTE